METQVFTHPAVTAMVSLKWSRVLLPPLLRGKLTLLALYNQHLIGTCGFLSAHDPPAIPCICMQCGAAGVCVDVSVFITSTLIHLHSTKILLLGVASFPVGIKHLKMTF